MASKISHTTRGRSMFELDAEAIRMKEQTPAVYIDVGLHDFREAFRKMRPDSFTYAGLATLYDYLVDLADDCGQGIKLDVIGLCGDFSEYESLADYRKDCSGVLWKEYTEGDSILTTRVDQPYCIDCEAVISAGMLCLDDGDSLEDYQSGDKLCHDCYADMETKELEALDEICTVIRIDDDAFITSAH